MNTFRMLGRADHKLKIALEDSPVNKQHQLPQAFSEEFREPQTIAECQDRLFELRQDLHKIRQQLNDFERQKKMNWSEEEYGRWRHKATHARNTKFIQQEKLNRWLQSQRARRALDAIQSHEPVAVLAELIDVVNDVRQRHRIALSQSQQNILSLADNIVNNEPAGK